MDSLHKLIQYFGEFPGIGPRQARRFAYFLLTKNPAYLEELSRLISEVKKNVHICTLCYRFYTVNSNSSASKVSSLCSICSDPHRDHSELMVVARDVDLETVEKSKTYQGLYFVLGGNVPILEKNPEARIRSHELVARIEKGIAKDAKNEQSDQLKEIVLSLNANPEGEHTAEVIRSLIRPFTEKNNIKITLLGRGLSTGTELEYLDSDTIKNALKNRA